MPRKAKTRESLDQILASCSDTLFPAEMGAAVVTLDSRDADGDTPLHVMLWRRNTYGALRLIEAGADVDAVGDMSQTPLHVAVQQGNADATSALLKAGADRFAISEFGKSPHDLALERGGDIRRCFTQT